MHTWNFPPKLHGQKLHTKKVEPALQCWNITCKSQSKVNVYDSKIYYKSSDDSKKCLVFAFFFSFFYSISVGWQKLSTAVILTLLFTKYEKIGCFAGNRQPQPSTLTCIKSYFFSFVTPATQPNWATGPFTTFPKHKAKWTLSGFQVHTKLQ